MTSLKERSGVTAAADPGETISGSSDALPAIVFFTNAWMMGGMEKNILDTARTLSRSGHRLAVLCYDTPAIAPLRDELRSYGVDVHELRGSASPLGRLQRLSQLVRVISSYRRPIVHLTEGWPTSDGMVILAAKLSRARAILRTEHQPPPPGDRRLRFNTRLKDRFLSRIVCVSDENRQQRMQNLNPDERKLVVITSGVEMPASEPDAAQRVRARLGIPADAPVIGVVSRLAEERKGINYFVEMAAIVAREEPDAHFVIVGDGALRPQLERQAEDIGVRSRLTFTGESKDVPALLSAMTVFVMPSLQEGGPYTLLEAMAMERPVVTTSVGLVPEVIRHGVNGLVVPVRDPEAMAQAVVTLLRDDELRRRIAREGRATAERHSVKAMVGRYVELYTELAGRRRKSL
ncbi:MAG TPA: glycosyltransferase [Dehalococcoidia bacterium]|nr:glycosyltransferase [Dehalococcoidia bacterium]